MVRGRRPAVAGLVGRLEGSEEAKRRLTVVLETLAGRRSVAAACAMLNIGESRFHALRGRFLRVALDHLEPRPVGRPGQAAPDDQQRTELEEEVRRLRVELRAARVREEIALALPHMLGRPGRPKKRAAQGIDACGRARRRT
jgi:hypothetical protein